MSNVKRVISNPDEVGRYSYGTKMSKQSSTEAFRVDNNATSASTSKRASGVSMSMTPLETTAATTTTVAGTTGGCSGGGGGDVSLPIADVDGSDRKQQVVKTVDGKGGGTTTASSHVAVGTNNDDEGNENEDERMDDSNSNNKTGNNGTTIETTDEKPSEECQEDEDEGGRTEHDNHDDNDNQSGSATDANLPRQVSVDTSNCHPPKVIEVQVSRSASVSASATSSVIRNKSESTVGSSAAGKIIHDNWGWFEDIHDHSNSNSSKGGGNNKSPTSSSDEQNNKKAGKNSSSNKKKKKKGGLLHFHDLVNPLNEIIPKKGSGDKTMMAVTAPTYVLEESQSSQQLWKNTAGTRPPQPVDERAFYEKVWAQNFKRSQVDYKIPAEVLTATSPISLSPFADGNFGDAGQSLTGPEDYINVGVGSTAENGVGGSALASEVAAVSSVAGKAAAAGFYGGARSSKNRKEALMGPHNHHHTLVNKKVKDDGTDDELTVLVRGDNVFGTTVSKSFPKDNCGAIIDTVSISIASYRVVESKKHGKYAQFLVIFCEGTFRDTVGVWKRYSDFEKLSERVTYGHEGCTSVLAGIHPLSVTEDPHEEMLPNAITSWNLLKKRKRWYRCLDAGYLSLKAFLLERFLHDILFESSTPQILRDFVGISNSNHQR